MMGWIILIIFVVLVIIRLVVGTLEQDATNQHIDRLIKARDEKKISKQDFDFATKILTTRDEY